MKPNTNILLELVEKYSCPDIAKLYRVSKVTVYRWLKSEQIAIKPRGYWHQFITKYNYNHEVFTREDETSYYLLGVFLTDGCMKKGVVSLSSADKEWISVIRDIICPNLPLNKEKSKCWRLNIFDIHIRNWLLSNGCIPAKSLTLEFPKIPEKYLPDFLRGCIDGDGTLAHKQYTRKNSGYKFYSTHWGLVSASNNFINTLSYILNDKEIKHCILQRKPGKTKNSIIDGREIIHKHIHYNITGCNKAALKFLEWVYYRGHKISLERKYCIAKKIFNHYDK